MHTTWSREGALLRIEFPIPLAARLFGLPFLASGGYFAYHLVLAVADAVRGLAPAAQLLAGVPLLLAMTLLFGAPGVLLVLVRKWIVIDQSRGTLEEVRHFVVYARRRHLPLAGFVKAWAVYRQPGRASSGGSRHSADYHVELTDANGRHELVGLLGTRPRRCSSDGTSRDSWASPSRSTPRAIRRSTRTSRSRRKRSRADGQAAARSARRNTPRIRATSTSGSKGFCR